MLGSARCRALPKSVRVSGTARERPRLVWFSWSTETITKGRDVALLPAFGLIGVRPVDVPLARLRLYHSGAGASKPDSSPSLSAR
jgi:hypothetical protein